MSSLRVAEEKGGEEELENPCLPMLGGHSWNGKFNVRDRTQLQLRSLKLIPIGTPYIYIYMHCALVVTSVGYPGNKKYELRKLESSESASKESKRLEIKKKFFLMKKH